MYLIIADDEFYETYNKNNSLKLCPPYDKYTVLTIENKRLYNLIVIYIDKIQTLKPFKSLYLYTVDDKFVLIKYEDYVFNCFISYHGTDMLKNFQDGNYVIDDKTLCAFLKCKNHDILMNCYNCGLDKYFHKHALFHDYPFMMHTVKTYNFKFRYKKIFITFKKDYLRKLYNIKKNKTNLKRRNKELLVLDEKHKKEKKAIHCITLNGYKLKKRYFKGYNKN